MYIRPRHVARACIVAGLAFAAFPLTPAAQGIRGATRAAAAPETINGLTPALIKQAAQHPINVIMVLRQGNGAKVLHDLQTTGATHILALNIVHGVAARVTAQTLKALRGDPDLSAITLDHSYKIYPSPDTAMVNQHLAQSGIHTATKVPAGQTLVSEPDTLSLIQADQVQKQFTGKGVRVAVLDSGIDLGQPDLKGVVAKGADGKLLYADFSGTDLTDTVGHGTACAGTIAGQAATVYVANDSHPALVYPPAKEGERFDNKTYFTYSGVAPGVKLLIGKILDARAPFSFTTDSNLVRAIGWAVANHADVISE
ncbi:MAG: S8 family peptidase, partial [Chloroflexota bacterium]